MKHPDPRQELRRRRLAEARYDTTINLCAGGAIVLWVIASVGTQSSVLKTTLQLIGGVCWFLGCGYLARRRGRSFWWGIIGCFPLPIFGALLIMLLPRPD